MQLTLLKGYPDFVGKRATFVGFGSGPASYTQYTAGTAPAAGTGGDPFVLPLQNWYIDAVGGEFMSVSGAFYVKAVADGVGPRRKWALVWYTAAGAQAGAGQNLSAEQVQIGGNCGQY